MLCLRQVSFSIPLSSALVTVCRQGILISLIFIRLLFIEQFHFFRIVVTSTRCFPSLFWAKWVTINCNKEQTRTHSLLTLQSPETYSFWIYKIPNFIERGEDNSSILELNTNINLITVVGQDELVRKSTFRKLLHAVYLFNDNWGFK